MIRFLEENFSITDWCCATEKPKWEFGLPILTTGSRGSKLNDITAVIIPKTSPDRAAVITPREHMTHIHTSLRLRTHWPLPFSRPIGGALQRVNLHPHRSPHLLLTLIHWKILNGARALIKERRYFQREEASFTKLYAQAHFNGCFVRNILSKERWEAMASKPSPSHAIKWRSKRTLVLLSTSDVHRKSHFWFKPPIVT